MNRNVCPRHSPPLWLTVASFSLLAACVSGLGAAQSSCDIRGRVIDDDGAPRSGAVVTLAKREKTRSTDADGRFFFGHEPVGKIEVVVVAEGFAVAGDRVNCSAGANLDLRVKLVPAFGEEMVVTGTRTTKRLADVAIPTQVIGREEIEMTAARTLADAVEFTSGLRVENNCQNCNFSQIRMLGLEGPYSQLLIDGMASVSSLVMVYGVEQLPARLIDSIEIVKGGGSATYGAGAVGGVINLISHQPSRTEAEVEASYLTVDSEPGYSLNAVGDWTSTDGERATTFFGQLDRIDPVDIDGDDFSEVSKRELLSIGGRYEHYVMESSGRLVLEGTYTDASRRGGDLENFRRSPAETALTEETFTQRTGLGLAWLHQVSPTLDYRVASSWADSHRDSYYGTGFDPDAYGTTDNPLFIVDAAAHRYFENSTITGGLELRDDRIVDVQLGYNRVSEEDQRSAGVFLQDDRIVAKNLNLLSGARVDTHTSLDNPIVSPRLALLWSPRPAVTVRTSVASGFRPPAIFDEDLHISLVGGDAQVVFFDPDLVEESSLGYLLSTEWRPTFARKGSAVLAVNLFRTELEDLFLNIENDDPTTPVSEFLKTNQGDAMVEGLEFSASMRWGPRISADFGFVQQSSRFGEPEPDFGSRDFFRSPDQYGSLGLIWRMTPKTDVFSGLLYTGSMKVPHYAGHIEEDRLETTGSFLTLDVHVTRHIDLEGRELEISAGIRNLTDEYQSDLDQGPDRDSAYVYGPRFPRSLVVGVKIGL